MQELKAKVNQLESIVEKQRLQIDSLQDDESKIITEMKRKSEAARNLIRDKDKEIEHLKNILKANSANSVLQTDTNNIMQTSIQIERNKEDHFSEAVDDLLSLEEVSYVVLQLASRINLLLHRNRYFKT